MELLDQVERKVMLGYLEVQEQWDHQDQEDQRDLQDNLDLEAQVV